jgi:Druantia protein DruA/Transposase DNA-binding/Transposase Tn5 dimerisation domain
VSQVFAGHGGQRVCTFATVKVGGQPIDDRIITRIQLVIDGNPGLSRTGLSHRICEDLKWRSRNGRWKEVACRVVMVKLSKRGVIRLPEAADFPVGTRKRRLSRVKSETSAGVTGPLKKIQPVELVLIGRAASEQSRTWNELMDCHHDLGSGPLVGAQLRYLIRSSSQEWLGGLSFSAAAWSLRARDEWIGWSSEAREQNLHQVVNNSRFLILPHVHVADLASHVLGQAVSRLAEDWKHRYGYEPLLLETYVDQQRYKGTCYRAANWSEIGETQGRGRQDREHRQASSVKRVFVYALDTGARRRLCEAELKPKPQTVRPARQDWAEIEFGEVQLGDQRLNRRLLVLARDFYARPQAQIPQACQTRAKTQAAYRFCKHPNTQMDVLIEPHRQASQQRIAEHPVVLAVQDTTSLNYSTHPATQGLGPIASQPNGIIGLIVHDTMAFSVEGTPLGLLDVQCWARDSADFGKKHKRKQRPIEAKESHKWLESFRRVAQVQRYCPNTMLVSVGDREADVYELFHLALEDPRGPKLLVRAEQDRLLEDGQEHLWPMVAAQPVAGIQEIHIPRRLTCSARVARLEVRFAQVTLKPPKTKSQYGPLQMWAVLAEEVAAPKDVAPLCWMLLTTCPITTFAQAIQKLGWYTKRWCIEIYHKTLKSGCKIEERQLGDADSIEACLAIDMVVAWRVYHLVKLGRETPNVPCTVFFEQYEWKALKTFITGYPYHDEPPSLREATRMVASLGGFLGRKGDGEPGTKSIWLGLQRLDDIAWTYKQLVPYLRPPPVSSKATYG